MNKTFYHTQLMELLEDHSTYKKLPTDQTVPYKAQLDALVEWGFQIGALSHKERKYLSPSAVRIPVIYTLPKIHKNLKVPPARPIVNGHD